MTKDPSVPDGYRVVRLPRSGPRGRQSVRSWMWGKEIADRRMEQRERPVSYGQQRAERARKWEEVDRARAERGVVRDYRA